MFNTVYVPGSVTTAESFIWYQASSDLQLGLAYLWKQSALRYLASWRLSRETPVWPSVSVSAGVQGIGTGNPGYSSTLEKNFELGPEKLNLFGGVGFRSNEQHGHPVAGFKFRFRDEWTLGNLYDGHNTTPFVTKALGQQTVGFYLVDLKSPGFMVATRF